MLRGGATTAAAALLFLPPWLLLLLHAAAADGSGGNGSCATSCGGMKVRYPFGFSPGCKVPLGCDHAADGAAWVGRTRELGLLLRNVTERALLVDLRPDCSRRLGASLDALFSGSYAPSARNALVVSSCNATTAQATTNCTIPPANYLNSSSSSHCTSAAEDSIRCVPPPSDNASLVHHFLNRTEMTELGKECSGLVSAVSYAPSPAPALLLGVMELEWWVVGSCRCSPHANCTSVTTPTQQQQQAFRCDCLDGFEGDGFADGAGCRKVPKSKCDTSKYLSGACGKTVQIALLMAGIVFGAMVTCVTCLGYHLLKRRSASMRTKRSTRRLLSETSCSVPFYSYREIERATNGFSEDQRLGTGAYGTVYAGRLSDDRLVAVKRIKQRDNAGGLDCVMNEVKLVSCVSHRNLVRLLGCCIEPGQQQILVYEFMPNGTLAEHLQRERGPAAMPWTVRLRIAAETAKAIAYLHSGVQPPIYHRDIKSSNILLDYEYNSKVADFGLSRMGKISSADDSSHISTAPQGTPGYVDPQYHQNFHLSDKSDVYSFGVVLVEIITAMKAVDFTRVPTSEINLAQLAVDRIGRGLVDDIVDPCLDLHRDAWTLTSIHKVAELAFRCLAYHSEMRPSMTEVADELEQIQLSGWAPSADDATFMSTTSSLRSSAPSTRATDRSWGAGRNRDKEAGAGTPTVNAAAVQDTAKGAVESPVSVQDKWFSERSSPSSNSLLGNSSLH